MEQKMENCMETVGYRDLRIYGLYQGYIRVMEHKMETTVMGYIRFRVILGLHSVIWG